MTPLDTNTNDLQPAPWPALASHSSADVWRDAATAALAVLDSMPTQDDGGRARDLLRTALATPQSAEVRLAWLHSPRSHDVDGYEWGIYRVKWADGKAVQVLQTLADFSDLDAAMRGTA